VQTVRIAVPYMREAAWSSSGSTAGPLTVHRVCSRMSRVNLEMTRAPAPSESAQLTARWRARSRTRRDRQHHVDVEDGASWNVPPAAKPASFRSQDAGAVVALETRRRGRARRAARLGVRAAPTAVRLADAIGLARLARSAEVRHTPARRAVAGAAAV